MMACTLTKFVIGTKYQPQLGPELLLVSELVFIFIFIVAIWQFVYVIAWFAVVFGINSTSNAEIIVQGEYITY